MTRLTRERSETERGMGKAVLACDPDVTRR